MDKLVISDLKIATLIGAYEWEKHTPQNIHLDITLHIDAQKTAQSDSIHDAVDYTKVMEHISTFAQNNQFQLIETFADRLAQELLTNFAVPRLQLTVHKPGAVLTAKNVSVSIERSK